MAVIQATVWSGRDWCEPQVQSGLAALDDVHSRLWLVYSPEQRRRLGILTPPRTRLRTLGSVPAPHGMRGREKKQATLNGWVGLWALVLQYWTAGFDLLLVEDDCIPPPDAALRLAATARALGAGAASGVTRSGDGTLPVFYSDGQRARSLGPDPVAVLATGTFCLWLARETVALMLSRGYEPGLTVAGCADIGKDVHLCYWLSEQGVKLLVDPAVDCRHYVTLETGERILRTARMTSR